MVTPGWFGVITPPSTELFGIVSVRLPLVGISPLSLPTITALSEVTSISAAEFSSIIRFGVEHLTFWRDAPLSGVVLFNQQY